jgi:hypothetical protein
MAVTAGPSSLFLRISRRQMLVPASDFHYASLSAHTGDKAGAFEFGAQCGVRDGRPRLLIEPGAVQPN